MPLESEILTNNYGIPPDFSKNLISFMKGDLEAAIKIIEASEKDIIILKSKFISNKRMSHGAFLIFFNFQTHQPEYVFFVISKNPNLTKLNIDNSWRSIFDIMLGYMTESECDLELSSKAESQFINRDNVNYLSSFFSSQKSIDLVNLKRFIINELSKILLDSSLILKLTSEETNIFKFSSFLKTVQVGLKIQQRLKVDFLTLINIKIEPILAPLGGLDVDKIDIYDELLVKVTDEREIVRFIMGYFDTSQLAPGNLYGKVVYNMKAPDIPSHLIIIEFAPGIFGRFLLGEKIRILVKKNIQKKPEDHPLPVNLQELQVYNIENYSGNPTTEDIQMAQMEDYGERNLSVYTVILIIAAGLAFVMAIFLWLLS
jgi:hypothetical protein